MSEISVFCGNLPPNPSVSSIKEIFESANLTVSKVDMKRGFCFVYVQGLTRDEG